MIPHHYHHQPVRYFFCSLDRHCWPVLRRSISQMGHHPRRRIRWWLLAECSCSAMPDNQSHCHFITRSHADAQARTQTHTTNKLFLIKPANMRDWVRGTRGDDGRETKGDEGFFQGEIRELEEWDEGHGANPPKSQGWGTYLPDTQSFHPPRCPHPLCPLLFPWQQDIGRMWGEEKRKCAKD